MARFMVSKVPYMARFMVSKVPYMVRFMVRMGPYIVPFMVKKFGQPGIQIKGNFWVIFVS